MGQLFDLIDGEHRSRLTRDFREKFHLSIHDIGSTVRYDEAWDLIETLLADPSSWLHAGMADWSHPLSYEGIVMLGLYDIELQAALNAVGKGKRFKQYPKPWPDKTKNKLGKATSVAELRAKLRPSLYNSLLPANQ